MYRKHIFNPVIALLLGIFGFTLSGAANADPPTRVARLGYMSGTVTFSPSGVDEWVQAVLNRPITTGDRVWSDAGSRAELQVGSAVFRLADSTSVSVLNLDDRTAQLNLSQGTLTVRVHNISPDQVYEVDTPNLAFSSNRTGDYRITVDPSGNSTYVAVRNGRAEVYGEGASLVLESGQSYVFKGTGLRDYRYAETAPRDDFDAWTHERDRRWERSVSARYVPSDLIGYQDLDDFGTWRTDARYGNVWIPSVPVGWAPYHDGHWAWVAPWGWTWVDDAPWGFAVTHYGRWADFSGSWGWVPGPAYAQPVYAPALVAFVGGRHFNLALSIGDLGGIAWFPLCPYDAYRPAYSVSDNYFNRINVINTTINNTTITNIYNNSNVTRVAFANQRVPGAVTAVPAAAFAGSQSVSRVAVPVSTDLIGKAPVSPIASIAPTRTSVTGPGATAAVKPSAQVLARPVMARVQPPPASVPFAAVQRQLTSDPGRPLDPGSAAMLRSNVASAGSANIRLVAPPQQAIPLTGSRVGGLTPPPANTVPRPPSHEETARGQVARPPIYAAPASPGAAARPPEARSGYPTQAPMSRAPELRYSQPPQAAARPPAYAAPASPGAAARPPEGRSSGYAAQAPMSRAPEPRYSQTPQAAARPPAYPVPASPGAAARPPEGRSSGYPAPAPMSRAPEMRYSQRPQTVDRPPSYASQSSSRAVSPAQTARPTNEPQPQSRPPETRRVDRGARGAPFEGGHS